MTQEEKAKAYDEALKMAKEMMDNTCSSEQTKCICQELFPELCGSEEENLKNKSGYYKAGKFWKASTLWNAVKGKSPQRVPNRYILQDCTWNIGNLQEFATEVKNVQEVNLDYPIILDMNGNILDGAHRVVKAYLEGKDIDIVYLGDDEWPEPDYDEEKAIRESEDEKIRKWLVAELHHEYDMVETDLLHPEYANKKREMLEKCIGWLEKQKEPTDKGEISNGYHTFNELYYYRMLYNAAFFNLLPKEWVHKSKKHHDGEECFGGGWFIVMANLPTGQISNHYELKDWELFQIPEKEVADEWDGHTPQDAADRLHKYLLEKQKEQKPVDSFGDTISDAIPDDWRTKLSTSDSSNPSGLKATNKSIDEINRETLAEQKDQKLHSTEETELNSLAFLEQMGYTCIPPGKAQKPTNDKAFEEWIDGWYNEHCSPEHNAIIMTEKAFKNWSRGIRNMYAEQKPLVKQLGGTFNSYDMAKTFVEGQHYVMEHPERFGLCKKSAEWSGPKEFISDTISKRLKSLHPQPKQECSACPKNIKGYINGRDDTLHKMSDFINSQETPPQSSWKPTKEQMEALGYAISGDFDKIPPTSYLSRRLEEIEEFLKTL